MKKPSAIIVILIFMALTLNALPLFAGGPILVDTDLTGEAVLWQNGVVHYNLESGPNATLGILTNDEATTLVRDLFDDWKNTTINGIDTVSLTLIEGTPLGSVDIDNLDQHFAYCPPDKDCPTDSPPFILGSAQSGESPIVFDSDGSITDAINGEGSSENVLGFAGPRVVNREDGILYITEGQAVLNGKFIDGVETDSNPEVSIDQFKGAIFHEIGHFLGLDHTQVNMGSVLKYFNGDTSEKEGIPTMFPIFIDGEAQLSAHYDDKVSISTLYPSENFHSSFCQLSGVTFKIDGKTELQGVNVLASAEEDPNGETTSAVSGSFYTGSNSKCSLPVGDFTISGLIPGKLYELSFEPINRAFTGGSSLEPCNPPQKGFAADTLPGSFSCSVGGEIITTGTETTSQVVTSKDIEIPQSTSSKSGESGGCSLIPE